MTLECANLVIEAGTGRVLFTSVEGEGREWASLEDLRAALENASNDSNLTILALLGRWLHQEPNGANPNWARGKAVDFDLISSSSVAIR